MQTWFDQIDEQRREREREQAAKAAQEAAQRAREGELRFTPMSTRIKKLLAHMPSERQQQGVSLATLRINLAGKYRGQAAPREVAAGLRQLGWERRRNWSRSGPFVALWFPPEAQEN